MGGCSSALIISMCGLVFLDVSFAAHYTDKWAVHIEGGVHAAKSLTEKHGFIFLGEIMPDFYHIQHKKVAKRSIYASKSHQVALAAEPQVKWIEQQISKHRVKRNVNFNDPKWNMMWYLNRGHGLDMNVRRAWERGYTGQGVVVTILDDGIERDHPDLRRNYDDQASYDVNDHDPDPTPRYDYTNENRHGTRCAGEVAAEKDNLICSVGVAYDASIGGVRMLDGDVTDSVEAQSLSHNPQHIHVYSASWGPDDDGRTVDGPATLARKAFFDGITKGRGGLGSIFVWASGNGGRDGDSCNCDGYTNSIYTLSISSATENGNIPWYSEACSSTLATTYSSGSSMERQIVTTDLKRGCTETHTGTSASAPLAAGLCALALQANSMLTWRDMQHIVVMTAKPENLRAQDWLINGIGRKVSHSFGYGLMDAAEMVSLAKNWTTVPKQQVCEIRYPEKSRVVPPNSRVTAALYSTGCEGRNNHVKYLEHVQARVTLTSDRRGEIQIFLTSPMGTRSTLLARRTRDTSQDGFSNWAFMTTHNWGEFAKGTWMLEIENGASASELREWVLVILGTKEHPRHRNVTPETSRMNQQFQSVYTCAGESPSSRVCIECRVGFYKLGSKCVATCPVQYYGYVEIVSSHNGNSNKTVATCRKCHPACNKCKGGRNTDCFECNPDYILESRQCIPKEFIESMSPYKFLIWFASIVVMLFVFYCAFRLCPQYLKQQEKQSIDQQPSQEMSMPPAPPSPLQNTWSTCNHSHQPVEQGF
ncbi:furin-like protease kpc-1 isoform X1 [Octopus vulgaris]|uniref:Furin-like protease kpc-1 isoform X1 n=2 Tax=Octopus TaxID=6643 RepID=A0AA36AS68_OCTVU|nr:furin-like protease kpc-1 isoform X1 [Octopus sinensis]CAI9721293.1 furin-like protease kpc-1 isoform X1 [Octopus vulgaris]